MKRPEQKVQRQLVGMLEYCRKAGHLRYFAVPNGGKRTEAEAAILVGQGVKAGVPDLAILFPDGRAAFVETKVPKEISRNSKLSSAQEGWRDWLLASGFSWAEIRDVGALSAFLVLLGVPSEFLERYEAPAWARVEARAG